MGKREKNIWHKIANIARKVLACQSFLERVGYQMKYDAYGMKDKSLIRNVSLFVGLIKFLSDKMNKNTQHTVHIILIIPFAFNICITS